MKRVQHEGKKKEMVDPVHPFRGKDGPSASEVYNVIFDRGRYQIQEDRYKKQVTMGVPQSTWF